MAKRTTKRRFPTVQELAKKGVMVNTVGLGSPAGATIIEAETGQPKKDENGEVVVSKLNEELLQELAQTTNGAYIHLTDINAALATLQDQYKGRGEKSPRRHHRPELRVVLYLAVVTDVFDLAGRNLFA
jgi:hypothetical protein